jgi:hypothetical protein
VTSGLEGRETTRTLNGTEDGVITSVVTGDQVGTVTTQTTIAHEVRDLVVPVRTDRADLAYPLSGSRIYATSATVTRGDESRTTNTRRVETFNGTHLVHVTITVNGVTRTCTLNLATRRSDCGNR